MIKDRILEQLDRAVRQAAPELNDLSVDESVLSGFRLERPRNPEHGDYAVNVSFLARHTRMAPPKIAEVLSRHLAAVPVGVGGPNAGSAAAAEFAAPVLPPATKADSPLVATVIGGYLNFKLTDVLLADALVGIIRTDKPGFNQSQATQRILLEYVSANPTGPLHIGHGRWAALGDSIVRILRHSGAFVTPEFYINDAGVQMRNIGHTLWYRFHNLPLPEPAGGQKSPFYPGEYVIELAERFRQEKFPMLAPELKAYLEDPGNDPFSNSNSLDAEPGALHTTAARTLCQFAEEELLAVQQSLLEKLGVRFENWISERRRIYEPDLIPRVLDKLVAGGYTYEAEGALWFKSSDFGDEKDRVLRKSDGSYTYLMPDVAYHDDKFSRDAADGKPYNRILNIWGADHHGYIVRMRGAIQALGHEPEQFEVLLGQLVNLVVEGERTRMGKRRRMLTLQDVVDEVGVDATRFWMVSKSADSALDFDVDLAASASSENPVFYVQYAHARCCSILRNATEPAPNVDTGEMVSPYVSADALSAFQSVLNPAALAPLFDTLIEERDKAILKTLVLQLDGFADTVADAARLRAPHFLTQYCMDVSAQFHSFYGVCRILTPEPEVTLARLMLIRAIQRTLAQALDLLGVSAPEKM